MIQNLFRELSMKKVIGYHQLEEWQKEHFDQTYKKHLSKMNIKNRQHYTEVHLEKVKWNDKNYCFKVRFDNGKEFHYTLDKKIIRNFT